MTTRPILNRRLTRGLPALAALLLAVALTGCIKLDMSLTVSDQTVSGPMIFAVDKQAIDFAQQFDENATADDILEDVDADFDDDLEGITAEPYEDERYVGTRYIFDNVPLEALNEAWSEDGDDEALKIVYHADSDTYEVTGLMDLSDAAEDADLGDDAEFFPPGLLEGLMGSFDISISFTFPGEILETTGEVSGTTVTWTPTMGESTQIHAIALASGAGAAGDPAAGSGDGAQPGAQGAGADESSSLLVPVLAGVGVLIVLAAVGLGIWLMRRSGGQPVPAGAPVPSQPAPAGYAGTPGYGEPAPSPTQPAPSPSPAPQPSPTTPDFGGGGDGGGGGGNS